MSEIAKHWIDSEWTASGIVSDSVNPATGAVLGRWADGGQAEARAAIAGRRHGRGRPRPRQADRARRPRDRRDPGRRGVLPPALLEVENAELSKIMPWAGTSRGPQTFLDNLGKIFTRWETEVFNVTTMFASGENVAVFGDFRYRSNSLGKAVSSPFSILIKVVDGKVTYLQFLEDSCGTAASFRKGGSWTVQTEPGAESFQV